MMMLTRIRPKWYWRWLYCDVFRLETEYIVLSGKWDEAIVNGLKLAREKYKYREITE